MEKTQLADVGIRDVALMALTVSSGAIDAISYLVLGKVFTAFMTGNIVFLGLHASKAAEFEVFRIARSLACFSIGVFLFRLIAKSFRDSGGSTDVWPREVTTGLVIMAIAQAGFLAVWVGAGGLPSSGAADTLVSLGAFAMGVQTGAVISLGLTGVVTTAATGTVVALIASIAPHSVREWRRLASVLVSLFVGATVEGVLLTHVRSYAPVLPLAGTILALVITAPDLLKHLGAGKPRRAA
jgi:uncharacterized membrane protein YoaK (UPF0700 family)